MRGAMHAEFRHAGTYLLTGQQGMPTRRGTPSLISSAGQAFRGLGAGLDGEAMGYPDPLVLRHPPDQRQKRRGHEMLRRITHGLPDFDNYRQWPLLHSGVGPNTPPIARNRRSLPTADRVDLYTRS
jgi:hypothetical protein